MGRYSLESFERYPMLRCRPKEIRADIPGAGVSRFKTVRLSLFESFPVLTESTLLEIKVSAEDGRDMALTESRLCALAAKVGGSAHLLGVTLCADGCGAEKRRLWESAARVFSLKRYVVPVTDGEQLDFAVKRGFAGGVLADVKGHPYDVCEAFAEHDAQQLYKRMPVFVRFAQADERYAQYAAQWHAMAVEGLDVTAGFRIALRRLTLPKAMTCGGFAPMRFWFTNRGPSLCHERVHLALRIACGGQYIPLAVHDAPDVIPLADRVHNEIIRLPDVQPGTYALEFALLTEADEPLVLANEGQTADGYYPACDLLLDETPRPEFETIWADFFPDGYYPLEDPKEPG